MFRQTQASQRRLDIAINAIGRPTKYDPERMIPKMLELYAQGASTTHVFCELGITSDTFYRWVKKHQLFSCAFKSGKNLSKSAWLDHAADNFENPKFQFLLFESAFKRVHQTDDSSTIDFELSADADPKVQAQEILTALSERSITTQQAEALIGIIRSAHDVSLSPELLDLMDEIKQKQKELSS